MMLNKFNLSSKGFFYAQLAFIIFALFTNLSCGKRKPPQPPVERITQRVAITGVQRGNNVVLSWNLPSQNAADISTLNINRADIYRLAEQTNASLPLSEEEFASRSTLISSLPITSDDFLRGQLNFTDGLQFGGQNIRLRYAVRLVNASGQKAAFSNFLLIEPTAKIAASPVMIAADISQNSIELSWRAPSSNVDGTTPANILGFNVYRQNEQDSSTKVLNSTPISDNQFSDQQFDFGINYEYYVRAVSLGANGEPVESLNSNSLRVTPKDTFPPKPPTAITIAAAPGVISIFFAVNLESDLAGYRIYRSTDRTQPLTEWTLVTSELLTSNTYQDKNVAAGETYYYYLIAVDQTGNKSGYSEIVSETAP